MKIHVNRMLKIVKQIINSLIDIRNHNNMIQAIALETEFEPEVDTIIPNYELIEHVNLSIHFIMYSLLEKNTGNDFSDRSFQRTGGLR